MENNIFLEVLTGQLKGQCLKFFGQRGDMILLTSTSGNGLITVSINDVWYADGRHVLTEVTR